MAVKIKIKYFQYLPLKQALIVHQLIGVSQTVPIHPLVQIQWNDMVSVGVQFIIEVFFGFKSRQALPFALHGRSWQEFALIWQ